jgi:hypothetical protein
MEKLSHGKEGEAKHSPWKRRNGGMNSIRGEQCDMTLEGRNSGAREDIHC